MTIRTPAEVKAALTEIETSLFRLRREGFNRSVPTEVGAQITVIEEAISRALGALDA